MKNQDYICPNQPSPPSCEDSPEPCPVCGGAAHPVSPECRGCLYCGFTGTMEGYEEGQP